MTSKSDPRGHPGLKLCVHVCAYMYMLHVRGRDGGNATYRDILPGSLQTTNPTLPPPPLPSK